MSNLANNTTTLQSILEAVNDLPAAVEVAAPVIEVSNAGLVTATAGGKSATKQLTTQAAKTVTPGTSNQTAVSSGVYTTGAVTVKGDSNLVAGNIKSGVSIFGVAGSYAGATSGGNVKTGTVTLSGNITGPKSVSVSGIGFKPKAVYMCTNSTTNLDYSGFVCSIFMAEGITSAYIARTAGQSACEECGTDTYTTIHPNLSGFTLTTANGSFTITSSSNSNKFAPANKSVTFTWIAVG